MYINNLITGTMTIGSGGSTPATRAITRIWWSNDESDYSDCPSNDGTFESICFPEEKSNEDAVKVEFGSDVTEIDSSVFVRCGGLTSVTFSNSITKIGYNAFDSCGFTSVTIPNSVEEIEDYAFSGCSDLTSVTFEGKDTSTVQGMLGYPFGLNYANENGVTIHCTDGDIQVQYG